MDSQHGPRILGNAQAWASAASCRSQQEQTPFEGPRVVADDTYNYSA